MLAAARRYKRVVQVGMQRRSTPHLVTARDRVIREGRLGTIGLVEIYCYYRMRARGNPPDTTPPENLNYEMWTGPAPMRPYNEWVHPRRWRAFMEYSNGIVGDMCVHMLDMVRWMLDLGMPTRISSNGGILVDKESKANITDTQTATFDFGSLPVVWTHRTYGDPPDPKYPWGATFYGDKGTLKASVMSYDFIPSGKDQQPIHEDVVYEFDKFPEDKTEKDLETHVAPAIRAHMKNFLELHRVAATARRRYRAGIYVGVQLHPGQHLAEAGTVADVGSRQGSRRQRRGSQSPAAAPISRPVGAPGAGDRLRPFARFLLPRFILSFSPWRARAAAPRRGSPCRNGRHSCREVS